MLDGTVNKCKDCCKAHSNNRYHEKSDDPQFIESERRRGREKHSRYKYKSRKGARILARKNFDEKYPEKRSARSATSRFKPSIKGNHLHHWSYQDEHLKDVIELSKSDHYLIHRFLVYDQEHKCFRTKEDGYLLNDKDGHLLYLERVLERPGLFICPAL
jgi:hypothetical protein